MNTAPAPAGVGETDISCLKRKQKGSINEKDTLFSRDHCAAGSSEWTLPPGSGVGVAGKRCLVRDQAFGEASCFHLQTALRIPGGRLLSQNDEPWLAQRAWGAGSCHDPAPLLYCSRSWPGAGGRRSYLASSLQVFPTSANCKAHGLWGILAVRFLKPINKLLPGGLTSKFLKVAFSS